MKDSGRWRFLKIWWFFSLVTCVHIGRLSFVIHIRLTDFDRLAASAGPGISGAPRYILPSASFRKITTFASMRASLIYILRFLGIFCLLYFGTLGVIGASAPGGSMHIDFVARYLDYVSWIKLSLVKASAFILSLFGQTTIEHPGYILQYPRGRGVMVAYSCVGYGVYSFWIAFVVANRGSIKRKFLWATGGVLALWLINVVRMILVLHAINKGWPMPFGLDHHTWFNIVAYLLIFAMIVLYDRSFHRKTEKGSAGTVMPQQQTT